MINRLAATTIWVKDQNEALSFYTEKLGFEIRADVKSGDYRWLTVGLPGQPDLEFQLEALKAGAVYSQEEVDLLTSLVESGKLRTGPWKTDDCQKTYEMLTARGVEFMQPPTERPYGIIDAVFKDNSGNVMLLTEDK